MQFSTKNNKLWHKISELEKNLTDHNHDKYITTPEFDTLAEANLIAKTDFDAKLSSLNRKITANKSNYLFVENKLKKLKTFDSSYFICKSHFEEADTQHYLVFQPIYRYFKRIAGVGTGNYIHYWQSKGLSDEKINYIKTANHSITPNLDYYDTKTRLEFNGRCLKRDSAIFNHGKVVNIYIVYKISKSINIIDYPTLENCLFGAVTFTKHTDIQKYKYFRYRIGFDGHESFSSCGIGLGKNLVISGVDMRSSTKIDNRKKDILILGEGPTQGLEHTLSGEKMYSINLQSTIKSSV